MEPIVWTEDFSVNVESLDNQHKTLFGLLNRLADVNDRKVEGNVIWDLLNEVLDYTRKHFTEEEEYMAELGYPGLNAHKLEHYELMKKVLQYNASFWEINTQLPAELVVFLLSWITQHILSEDMAYVKFATQEQSRGAFKTR